MMDVYKAEPVGREKYQRLIAAVHGRALARQPYRPSKGARLHPTFYDLGANRGLR